MEFDTLFLSRIQFAFTVAFHIIFPSFTIGLAAWLALLDFLNLRTGNPIYRRLFEFWIRIFTVSFSMGVVSGIVMAFEIGTNWSVLADKGGAIQGPLLGYEAYTAFALEASFLGVMLFGRTRVAAGFYLFSCCMVALGTTFSTFWIMVSNTWMQYPVGYAEVAGKFVPVDWLLIISNDVFQVRIIHMLLSAYLTTCFCVAAAGAAYLLRDRYRDEARLMVSMSLWLAALLIPIQLYVGHLNGDYVHQHQPAKFAAIEARWHAEQPASELLIGIPDSENERNLYSLSIPRLGSFIASGTWDSREVGLSDFPKEDRPPVAIPFYFFRIMVAMGLLMMSVTYVGIFLLWRKRVLYSRWFQWVLLASFPSGFIAILSGWLVAEVGRQPWVIYGILRTADAHTPTLTTNDVWFSLLTYILTYSVIFFAGSTYMWRLLQAGPTAEDGTRDVISLSTRRPIHIDGPGDN
ncbi:MAG: cytochrome ubiquinol oxidase subunit I [Gammaproteobacteria bacterium]|nr:cytochrome ubiquinol oxidase subunit I [Gammaproteobacteria bacterium]